MRQVDAIRSFLLEGNSLTPLDALEKFGCFRLAARIDDLRQEGLDIETIKERQNGKSYARYRLRDKQGSLF
jgi:hypothetical protein